MFIYRTALFITIEHKNQAIFDLLIGQDQVDVNVSDKDGHSPLEEALFDAKDLGMASALVNRDADINSKDANGLFPKMKGLIFLYKCVF
jgi:ankyrin repeat protein